MVTNNLNQLTMRLIIFGYTVCLYKLNHSERFDKLFLVYLNMWTQRISYLPGPEVIKLFSCSSQLSIKFKLAAPMAERLRALFLNHLTAVSGVGLSPALATCETSQVLLAGVPGGFSWGYPIFAPPTEWPVSYELK